MAQKHMNPTEPQHCPKGYMVETDRNSVPFKLKGKKMESSKSHMLRYLTWRVARDLLRYRYKVPNIKVPNHKIPNNKVPNNEISM